MEKLYYDVNYVSKEKLSFEKIKLLFLFLFKIKSEINGEYIKGLNYDNFNDLTYSSYYYDKSSYLESNNIIFTENNYEDIIKNNTIIHLYLTISIKIKVHIMFCYISDSIGEKFFCVHFFFTINELIDDNDLFFYIGEMFFHFLDLLNPEIVNMGDSRIPISKNDIKNGNIEGDFIFINKSLVNEYILNKYSNEIKFQKLRNGYIFYYIDKMDIIFKQLIL